MDIDEDCLKTLGELTVLAGIMREITYNGFTKKQSDLSRAEFYRRVEKVQKDLEDGNL